MSIGSNFFLTRCFGMYWDH